MSAGVGKNVDERLPKLHRLAIGFGYLDDLAGPFGGDMVHQLHRLDDPDVLTAFDVVPDAHERRCAPTRMPH